MTAAPFTEDSYGRVRRLEFVAAAMPAGPAAVLDVGCGTGSQLTLPLARLFPQARILGVDSDAASIAQALSADLPPNVSFGGEAEVGEGDRFDVVIASEVLEHVEDPHGFLLWLRSRLGSGGRLLLTVPNGWGASELAGFAECLLTLTGVWPALRRFKRRLIGGGGGNSADTLAVSPHVNFFTRRQLSSLFAAAGLRVRRDGRRSLFCGFLLDQIVHQLGVQVWNARVVDGLPAWFASDWMFELEAVDAPAPSSWRRGWVAGWRRSLNRRRWGLAP